MFKVQINLMMMEPLSTILNHFSFNHAQLDMKM